MARKSLLFLALMVVIAISGCASAPTSQTRREVVYASVGRQPSATVEPTRAMGQYQPIAAVAKEEFFPAQQSVSPAPAIAPIGCNGRGPEYFASAEDCSAAMFSGECSYYTPRFYGNRGRNPVDGVTKVALPLHSSACVREYTVYGVAWVPQKKGDLFRFRKKAGMDEVEFVPYARNDCGNPVKGIVYPRRVVTTASPPQQEVPPPQPPAVAQVQQAPAPVVATPAPPSVAILTGNICTDSGFVGEQYYPGWTPRGDLACFEKLPWYAWENLKTPVAYVTTVAIVGGVAYCATTGRCGFWKKSRGGSPTTTGGGPVGGSGTGGPVGGGGTGGGGPVGGGAIY